MAHQATLLYDGECGFCDCTVRWVLRRDRHKRVKFAPLQSETGKRTLRKLGLDEKELSTMILIVDPGTPNEKYLVRGKAAATVLQVIGGGWAILGVARFLPRFMLDFGYTLIANNRNRLMKRMESCRIPTAEERDRFIDMPEPDDEGAASTAPSSKKPEN